MYRCRVERDSISPEGDRLTSFIIQFPRVVLAETVTHRMNSDTWGECEVSWCERTTTKDISKNSASSRAIPFTKMLERIQKDPYMPNWTVNQKGMQGEEAKDSEIIAANRVWLRARDYMVECAEFLANKLGIHKQDCNRLLEPWAWITQIVTSSRWDNFFYLRCDKMAHPAFQRIARMMYLARRKSVPIPLEYGQWHLPFVPMEEQMKFKWEVALPFDNSTSFLRHLPDLIQHSAARCAWVSYESHDKDSTPEKMVSTFDRLVGAAPVHASPTEHQATPMHPGDCYGKHKYHSNLLGWIQARKLIPMERVDAYQPSDEEIASWGISEPLWPEE